MKKILVSIFALCSVVSLAAQDLTTVFNDAVNANNSKDYASAIAGYTKVIDEGMDDDAMASMVATSKAQITKCYFMLGGKSLMGKDYNTALTNFQQAADLSALYDDVATAGKANRYIGVIYQTQAAEAYNAKDYATAASFFKKGYDADPNNMEMALNLAMSYCEMGEYSKGMEIYETIASKTNPKYEASVAKANEMMALYTNNKVAALQAADDFDGIIAMAGEILERNPQSALAQKIQIQAYSSKKDFNKVIELGEAAATAQTSEEDKGLVYLAVGAAYNAKELKPQAMAAFRKVTAGPALASAQAALAELSK